MRKTKLSEEIKLIGLLSVLIPTAVLLTTPALWWECDPIKVFAGYLLGISEQQHCYAGSACMTR